MKKFFLVGTLIFISFSTLIAQWDNPIFRIRPEDDKYLQYFFYRNNFDSAFVTYTFGEIKVKTGNTWNRVLLSSTLKMNQQEQGEEGQGENTHLLQYSRSMLFTLPDSGEISFYRQLSVYQDPCGNIIGTDNGNIGGSDGQGNFWLVGKNRIQDRTEFVIQIVRASDSTVLFIIDSVGVKQNPLTNFAPYYGTGVNHIKTIRQIPLGFGNTEVFLQISPRRYGLTPYGIDIKPFSSWISLSSIFEYDTSQVWGLSDEQNKILDSIYFNQILTYFDSVKLTIGKTPIIPGLMFSSDSLANYFYDRYYDLNYDANGKKFYTEKVNGMSKSASDFPNKKKGIVCANNICKLKDMEIESLSPNPTTNSSKVTIYAYKDISNVTIDIYTISGQRIAKLWSGILSKGTNEINVDFSDYANGTYAIYCNNQSGETIDFDKIVIVR